MKPVPKIWKPACMVISASRIGPSTTTPRQPLFRAASAMDFPRPTDLFLARVKDDHGSAGSAQERQDLRAAVVAHIRTGRRGGKGESRGATIRKEGAQGRPQTLTSKPHLVEDVSHSTGVQLLVALAGLSRIHRVASLGMMGTSGKCTCSHTTYPRTWQCFSSLFCKWTSGETRLPAAGLPRVGFESVPRDSTRPRGKVTKVGASPDGMAQVGSDQENPGGLCPWITGRLYR